MELVVESDIYSPSIDDKGNYIDKIPSFNIIKKGLLCSCGARKDKTYETHAIFSAHVKTKAHQSWLITLNFNKANFYIENQKLTDYLENDLSMDSQEVILLIVELEKLFGINLNLSDINRNMTILQIVEFIKKIHNAA